TFQRSKPMRAKRRTGLGSTFVEHLPGPPAPRLLLVAVGLLWSFCGFGKSALALCFPGTRTVTDQNCDGPFLHLRDDLDRTANRETQLAVRAPLIDGDFSKSVGILVPESRARRSIAEGPLALQLPVRRGKPRVGRQHGRPQPGHGIAEMIDVDD